MCGIVVYIGLCQVSFFFINGLKLLEYCGYDSVGVVVLNGDLKVFKCKGKVVELEVFIEGYDYSSMVGLGYICWAIYGEFIDINVYFYCFGNGWLVMVYNGIIENYVFLKIVL